MVDIAAQYFGNGIWIKYDGIAEINKYEIHPCGYDFLSFENIEMDDHRSCWHIENYEFIVSDFSDDIYSRHPLEGCTLEQILDIIGEKNWNFERF